MIVGDTSLQPVNALAAGQQGYAFGQQQALMQNALAQQRQQQAQQQQLNSLAPQAFSSDPAQQQNAIAQMAAYGPQGIEQAKGIQGLQAGQQSQQAAVLQQLQQKRNDVAQMVAAVQAVQDPNARQQVYQQQIQLARAKGDPVDMFENLPADQGVQLALGNIAKADQLLQAAGIGQKPITVSQGQTVYQPGPNNAMTPIVQGNPWKFDAASGTMVNEQTGQFRPVTAADQGAAQGGVQPQGDPGVAQPGGAVTNPRVTFNFAPGTPPEVIAAAKAEAQASGDLSPGQSPQTLAAYKAAQKPNGFNANQPQELGNPQLSGTDYLNSIPQADRGTVLAVLQGRMAPPSGSAQKSSYWMGVLNAANKIDPTFDAVDYQSRYKTAQSYAPSGAQGSQVIALNTMIQHINKLQETYDKIGNGSSPLVNRIVNRVEYESGRGNGHDAISAYELNANAAAQEIESLWKKGGGNESDIALYRDKLSSANDPATQRQVIGKMLDLALGRLQSLHSAYVNAMGSGATPKQFVTPQSLQIVKSIAPEVLGQYQQNASAPATGQIANPGTQGWAIQRVQ